MINILESHSSKIRDFNPNEDSLSEDVLWIDLVEPSPDEVSQIETQLGVSLPNREAMREIEASRRVNEVDNTLRLTATLMLFSETLEPKTAEVTFVLVGSRLITLRYSNPRPFRNIEYHLERTQIEFSCGSLVLSWILTLITGRLADILEIVATDLDAILQSIVTAADENRVHPDLTQTMGRIGRNGDKGSKALVSVHTLTRILIAASESELVPEDKRREFRANCSSALRDLRSLSDYAEFQESRIGFILDALLGLISIEQNNIGKIFSVVATVFLPPTLIGSIYGMNFQYMPSLDWKFGYPMSIGVMILSALLPLWFFRKMRWL